MNAFWNGRRLIRVASSALYLPNLCRMRKLLDLRVAIGAPENSMRAGGVLRRPNRNILSFFGFHSCLAVARQTSFVLFQRFCGLVLPASAREVKVKTQYTKHSGKQSSPSQLPWID